MKKIILFLCSIVTTGVYSQNSSGIAIYKKSIEIVNTLQNDTLSNRAANDFVNKIALEGIEEVKNLEFELQFKNKESLFKVKPSLSMESEMAKDFAIMLEGGKGSLYSDLKSKTFLLEQEAYGELFIISSSIDSIQWEITNQQKMISNYLCYKAVGVKKSRPNEVKNNTYEAWFSPEISVPFGPTKYCNLPGLIIELNITLPTYKVSFYLQKIEFKNEEEIYIKKPDKGIKVTEDEFKNYGRKMYQNFKKMGN